MTSRVPLAMTLGRTVLAVALALSWLLLAGTPAAALIPPGSERVEKPKQGAVIKEARPLIVAVDRIGDEKVTVHTQLFYGGTPAPPEPEENSSEAPEGEQAATLQPVSKKVLELPQIGEPVPNGAGQVLRFGAEQGGIDPYGLAWLPNPGVARNGQYTLEFRAVTDADKDRPWQRYEFRLDAPPPPTSAPGIAVADAAAKRLSIAWQAHPVPDLSHYIVERQVDGGDWKVAKAKVDPKTTQISDVVGKYGSYRYRVTAVRPAGDGSDETRSAVSPPSGRLALVPPGSPQPDAPAGDGDGDGDGDGPGTGGDGVAAGDGTSPGGSTGTSPPPPLSSGTTTGPGLSSADEPSSDSDFGPPEGFEDTYEGPLDYNVQQAEVTERVPVDMAQPSANDTDTLTVLDRTIDQSQVLPPVAGGLILVVSAGHVLRYLHD